MYIIFVAVLNGIGRVILGSWSIHHLCYSSYSYPLIKSTYHLVSSPIYMVWIHGSPLQLILLCPSSLPCFPGSGLATCSWVLQFVLQCFAHWCLNQTAGHELHICSYMGLVYVVIIAGWPYSSCITLYFDNSYSWTQNLCTLDMCSAANKVQGNVGSGLITELGMQTT